METEKPRRSYRMQGRAKTHAETRERIVAATMQLHDERGVASASFVEIAKRAGIGVATVYRHFPTLGSLVSACGAHVWNAMDPPMPDRASEPFVGIHGTEERLKRLVAEIDQFYQRGALRLAAAHADRHVIAELNDFIGAIETGVSALVREAVKDRNLPHGELQLMITLMSFPVWNSIRTIDADDEERQRLVARLLGCVLRSGT